MGFDAGAHYLTTAPVRHAAKIRSSGQRLAPLRRYRGAIGRVFFNAARSIAFTFDPSVHATHPESMATRSPPCEFIFIIAPFAASIITTLEAVTMAIVLPSAAQSWTRPVRGKENPSTSTRSLGSESGARTLTLGVTLLHAVSGSFFLQLRSAAAD